MMPDCEARDCTEVAHGMVENMWICEKHAIEFGIFIEAGKSIESTIDLLTN